MAISLLLVGAVATAALPVAVAGPGEYCCGGGGETQVRLPSTFAAPTNTSNWAGVSLPVEEVLSANATFELPSIDADFSSVCGGSDWSEDALLTGYTFLGWVGLGGGAFGNLTWPFWQAGYSFTLLPTESGEQPTSCSEVWVEFSLFYEGWKDVANAETAYVFDESSITYSNWQSLDAGASLTVSVATDGAGNWIASYASSALDINYTETDGFLYGDTTLPDGAGFIFEPPYEFQDNGGGSGGGDGWAPLPQTYDVPSFAFNFTAYTFSTSFTPSTWLTWYIGPQDNGFGNSNSAWPITSTMNNHLGVESYP